MYHEKNDPKCIWCISQTLIKLCNRLAGCQAPDSRQTPSSITIYSGHNPCSILRLGFRIGQMRLLFGGITNRIEKIHQTRESDCAKRQRVYTMAVKAQHQTTRCGHVYDLDNVRRQGETKSKNTKSYFQISSYIP